MDELPALLEEAIGDAEVVDVVDVGGGDAVAITAGATHLYRSDGLLSDETVESFDHDVDAFSVEQGRRKHRIVCSGADGERSFTVPARVAAAIVAAMLGGILRTSGLLDAEESVREVFRFSDLTVVVTDAQLLKHVGRAVWNNDHEAFAYADLIALDFEEGSVNTQVIVQTDARGERIKVPNDHARRVRAEIESAVFEFHDVSSLSGLREVIAPDDGEGDDGATDDGTAADEPGAGADDESDADRSTAAKIGEPDEDGFVSTNWSPPADQDITGPRGRVDVSRDGAMAADADDDPAAAHGTRESTTASGSGSTIAEEPAGASAASRTNGAVAERLAELNDRVAHQTELLEAQQETIAQLVEELRRGR